MTFEDIDQLNEDLWGFVPGGTITVDEKNAPHDSNNYITSFHNQGQYQWPVQVHLIPNLTPEQLQLKHFKPEYWEPINKGKDPYYAMGTFIPHPYGGVGGKTHPKGHFGVDLSAPIGTPIYPIGPGKVVKTTPSPTRIGGITVNIEHENGNVKSYYAHMNSVKVSPGQEVDFNTMIGTVGKSGNAQYTSPHLHYQVSVDGKLIDPQSVIGKQVGTLSTKSRMKESAANMWKLLEKLSITKIEISENQIKKNAAFAKMIDKYLNSDIISGQEVMEILGHKSGDTIGKVVKALKNKLDNTQITKDAAKEIISLSKSS